MLLNILRTGESSMLTDTVSSLHLEELMEVNCVSSQLFNSPSIIKEFT